MAEKLNKKLSTSTLIVAIVQAILTLVGFVISLVTICQGGNGSLLLPGIVTVIMYALVIFYCVYGYRIPHGDLMKYVFLIFALQTCFLASYYGIVTTGDKNVVLVGIIYSVIMAAVTVIIAFMAGRLDRIKENEGLGFMALILLVTAGAITAFVLPAISETSVIAETKAAQYVMPFTQAILWGSLFLAYSIRFDLHKKAGKKEPLN